MRSRVKLSPAAVGVGLATATFITRLPWLFVDYGGDPDSYRVVYVARQVARTGQYSASRFPGYPVHELAVSLVSESGPWASNGMTALCSAAAVAFLYCILLRLKVRDSVLVAAAFALTPAVYVNSTCTIDYVWALAFLMGSLFFVLSDRPWIAGACLGLAVGCRITSGALLVPLSVYLVVFRKDVRTCARVAIACLFVGGLCFLPLVMRYGLGFLTYVQLPYYPSLRSVLVKATTDVWGTLGVAAFAVAAIAASFRWLHGQDLPDLGQERRGPLVLVFVAMLVFGALFLRLPYESGYLVPFVPFACIAAALLLPSRLLRVCMIALCFSSFMTIGRSGVSFFGPILSDHVERALEKHALAASIRAASPRSIVVCGFYWPRVLVEGAGIREGSPFVYVLESDRQAEAYRASGHALYFLPGGDVVNKNTYGVDLIAHGALPMPDGF